MSVHDNAEKTAISFAAYELDTSETEWQALLSRFGGDKSGVVNFAEAVQMFGDIRPVEGFLEEILRRFMRSLVTLTEPPVPEPAAWPLCVISPAAMVTAPPMPVLPVPTDSATAPLPGSKRKLTASPSISPPTVIAYSDRPACGPNGTASGADSTTGPDFEHSV